MKVIDISDFEMVTQARGPRNVRNGFSGSEAPKIRVSLHIGGRKNSKDYRQLCIALNKASMSYARFVAGDKVNLMFSKDKSHMVIERHPKGLWTLSPVGASKDTRLNAVGKAHGCAVKLTAPDWAKKSPTLKESFIASSEDIASDGSRLLVTVNL